LQSGGQINPEDINIVEFGRQYIIKYNLYSQDISKVKAIFGFEKFVSIAPKT
jgi:hypothetical protein